MRLSVLLRRELALAWGRGGGPLLACAFYVCTATLLPLAAGPSPARLAALAPGLAWLTLALSSLLSLERLFERDFEDGALDLLALGPAPLEMVCAVKCLAQWLAAGAPLALAAPLISIALGAPPALAPLVFVAALVGGLGFSFTGGLGAALALGGRRGRGADHRDRPAAVRPAGDLRRRRHRGLRRGSRLARRPGALGRLQPGRRGPVALRHGGGVPQRAVLRAGRVLRSSCSQESGAMVMRLAGGRQSRNVLS